MYISLESIKKYIIIILICFMPLHHLLFDVILDNSRIDNLWRDVLLISSVVFIFATKKKITIGNTGVFILVSWFIGICYLVFSENTGIASNIFRTYFIPSLIYFLVINTNIDFKF